MGKQSPASVAIRKFELSTWFARIGEFELADPDAVTWTGGQVRGPRSVPVRFAAGG